MRLTALAIVAAVPALAETPADALPLPTVEPALEARLVPAVLPRGDILGDADEWMPGAARMAAIVGPDGLEIEAYRVAETFDDRPLDDDAALAEADYDDM